MSLGEGGAGSKVCSYEIEGVFGLKGVGDFVKVIQVKFEVTNPFFDVVEVSPEVTSTQIVPVG